MRFVLQKTKRVLTILLSAALLVGGNVQTLNVYAEEGNFGVENTSSAETAGSSAQSASKENISAESTSATSSSAENASAYSASSENTGSGANSAGGTSTGESSGANSAGGTSTGENSGANSAVNTGTGEGSAANAAAANSTATGDPSEAPTAAGNASGTQSTSAGAASDTQNTAGSITAGDDADTQSTGSTSSDGSTSAAEGSETNAAGEEDKASESAETSEKTPEEEAEEKERSEKEFPAFDKEVTLDGVRVRVHADEGTFPEGAVLSVEKVAVVAPGKEEVEDEGDAAVIEKLEAAIREVRENENVVISYTFDIKVRDAEGREIQPADENKVRVSFAMAEIAEENLNTNVYHIEETDAATGEKVTPESTPQETTFTAKPLDLIDTPKDVKDTSAAPAEQIATVETDGFSYYTVEFTYGDKQYVLEGGGVIKLDDLLKEIGIEGKVKGVSVSAPELFSVIMGTEDGVKYTTTFSSDGTVRRPTNNPKGDVRYVASYEPFDTEEWMDVLMEDGTTYHIIVTDANMDNGNDTRSVTGLHQGTGTTFADTIPVADIWINQSMVNDSVESRNSATFIPGDLMTSDQHPGFIGFDAAAAGYTDPSGNTAGHAGYEGNFFVEFDTRKETLNGEVTTTKDSTGATVYQSYNYFEGVVGTFKWENAAIRLDDSGQEEYLDVYVEYYNPMITIETPENATSAASVNDAVLGLFGGNMIALGGQRDTGSGIDSSTGALGFRYGVDIKVRPYVADKSGKPVPGKFYYPMVHLNVDRTPYNGFRQLYAANDACSGNYDPSLHQYSEQVKIENGLVQNLDGDIVYIKGGAGDSYNYYAKIDYDNGQYTIYPGSTGAPESTPQGDLRSDFYQGFLALVENGSFDLTYNAATAPNNRSSIETYILAGTDFNYRLRHTTETLPSSKNPNPAPDDGGTIQTTRYGNHSGQLDDGEIIDPAVIATATGQTVTYTFYPKQGYGLRELWVWNDTVTTYGNTAASDQKAYVWEDGANRYSWNENDQSWHSVGHYNLTTNPENYDWVDGIYTYKYDSGSGDWQKIGTFGTTLTGSRTNYQWTYEDSGTTYVYIYDTNDDKWVKYNASDTTTPVADEDPPADATTVMDTVSEPPAGATTDLGQTTPPPSTATNVFPSADSMQGGTIGRRIYEGSGDDQYQAYDDDNDGNIDRYVYTFTGIHSDNAIHVIWGQTILNITKKTTGTGTVDDNGNPLVDTFTFRIKAWGDKDGDGTDEYIDFTAASDDPKINARFTSVGNDLYEFTLQSGETLGISPESIPVGYTWEVTEVQSRPADSEYGTTYDDWTPVGSTTKQGTFVEQDESQTATFTNNRKKIIDPKKKLTVKKVWANDTAQLRPNKINITIEKPAAVGITAANFKSALTNTGVGQSSIRAIKSATKAEYDAATNAGTAMRNATVSKGSGTVKMWRSGTTVYFYSESAIYLTGSAKEMFANFTNLADLSGLEDVHTDFVTSFENMFMNDQKITDLSPLANWNTANVENMAKMFAKDSTGSGTSNQMNITSLEPLRNWQTQNVTTMRRMFHGGGSGIEDAEPLSGWDVDRVTNFDRMFFRTAVANNDLRCLDGWDIASGTSFSEMFMNSKSSSPGQQSTPNASDLPDWSASRAGAWNNGGTYTAYDAIKTPTSPENKNDETAFWAANKPESKTTYTHEVDENDSNTWIYEFEVDEGSKWNVYEMLPDTVKEFYTCSAEGVDGRGMKADPVTGVQPETTTVLTNTRKEYELRIKKDTDIATTDKFNFTLTLWTGTTEMAHPYNLPDDHRLIVTNVFNKTADGTYAFTMGSPASLEIFLPAGVRYRVVEESKTGWSLTSSHNTHGVLNESKEASFLNTQADLFKVVKLWEGDSSNNVIYKTRPTGEMSLGIVVTTIDQTVSGRWKIITGTLTTVTSEDADFANLAALYNASSDAVTVYDTTGDSEYPTTAARKVQIEGVDYALDKVSDTEFKRMQIESGDHKGSRWKRNGTTQTIQNSNTQYSAYKARYDAASVSVSDVRDTNGQTAISVTAAKIVEVGGADYVYDLNGTTLTVIPVENVPFTKTYTKADTFFEDDGAGGWLYEYNISDTEDVISVVETSIPSYYQKVETTTNADGEVSYQITNTLETRNLTVKKTTVDNEPGEFNFGIKFWVENDTSERHPVKVGHSQILTTEDGEGNTVYEYEFTFEQGVTLDGVDVYGPHEVIGDDTVKGTLTKAQAETLVNVIKSITVGASDADFTRHNSTGITLADLGLAWNGISTYDLYVEQNQDFITNMMTNGRRLDWFIIPTPGHDEEITVRTPYTLKDVSKPSGLTGTGGTYYFTLQNGGSVTFSDLPMGVSYDIVEFRKSGWDQVGEENETGAMTDGAVEKWTYNGNSYDSYQAAVSAGGTAETITKNTYAPRVATFTNEREKGTIKVVKETVQNEAGTFTFRAMTGRVVDPANVKDQDGNAVSITRIYPEGKAARTEETVIATEHQNYVAYLTSEGRYRFYQDGHVTLDAAGTDDPANGVSIGQLFNYIYPYQFTTMDGMNYKFSYATDPETGNTTSSLAVETTTFEFKITKDNDDTTDEYVTIEGIPYGSRDKIWELTEGTGWKLVAVDGDTSKEEIDATMSTDQTVTHTFLNDRDTVDLTVSKTVTGNQGSRDKYFKFKIEIENAGERTLHLDMSNATRTFDTPLTETPNTATIYTKDTILNGSGSEGGNTRDDDFETLTYGTATEEQKHECEWQWTDDQGTTDTSDDVTYIYKWDASNDGWTQKNKATDQFVEEPTEPPADARRTGTHGQHILTGAQGTTDYGKATIYVYLQHGQTATIRDLPIGSKYTVTEITEDYRASREITGPMDGSANKGDAQTGEAWNTGAPGINTASATNLTRENTNVIADTFIKANTEITFSNTRNGVVPTEIRFNWKIWLLLLGAAAAYFGWRFRQRRRA